jgi:hypothetical protein
MTTINDSQTIFKPVRTALGELLGLPRTNEADIKKLLTRLEEVVRDLEHLYNDSSLQANALGVERAAIIGEICLWVKNSLLHGQWTEWAAQNFSETLRTLEKYMSLAKSHFARQLGHLGTERTYQLSRIEHLMKEKASFQDLFQKCGLDEDLQRYTSKELERAVAVILNQEALLEHGINLPNEVLQKLTENFSLIKDHTTVLGRLCEAKAEDANLEKTVANVIASGGSTSSKRKNGKTTAIKENINAVAELFIRCLQEAIEKPDSWIDENRLKFVLKLVTECLEVRCNRQ